MNDDTRKPASGGSTNERGGVLVLRVWADPEGELIGRVQWTARDAVCENIALVTPSALLREVLTFLDYAENGANTPVTPSDIPSCRDALRVAPADQIPIRRRG